MCKWWVLWCWSPSTYAGNYWPSHSVCQGKTVTKKLFCNRFLHRSSNAKLWPTVTFWKTMLLHPLARWNSLCVDQRLLSRLIPVTLHLFALAALKHVLLLLIPLALAQMLGKLLLQICINLIILISAVKPDSTLMLKHSKLLLVFSVTDVVYVGSGTTRLLLPNLNFEQLYLLLTWIALLYLQTNENNNFIMRF